MDISTRFRQPGNRTEYLLMPWLVSTVRTGVGWQVSVDRPGNTALLDGLFQNLVQKQAGRC